MQCSQNQPHHKGPVMTFEEWFSQRDWWKENTARERLSVEWDLLRARGIPEESLPQIFDNIIDAIEAQFT